MSNQLAFAGSAPTEFPLDLTGVSRADLADLCKEMYSDLTFLSKWVSPNVGSAVSTGITAVSSMIAGGIDGYLGEKANIGPIDINMAIALGAAAGSILSTKDADTRELCAAVARGVGAPILYEFARGKTEKYAATRAARLAAAPAQRA